MRMYLGLGLGQTNLLFSFLGRSKKCCGVGGDVGGGGSDLTMHKTGRTYTQGQGNAFLCPPSSVEN